MSVPAIRVFWINVRFQRNNYQANKFAFPINSENPPPYKPNQAYKTDRV